MQYGSLQNMMYGASKPAVPEVGMGATEVMWTDRHAYTIIEVSKNGKKIKVQRDKATRTDNYGMSDSQEYKYESDPEGYTREVSLRKDGKWREVNSKSGVFQIGIREEYYDYSF